MQLPEAPTSAEQMTYLKCNEAGILRMNVYLGDLPGDALGVGGSKCSQFRH